MDIIIGYAKALLFPAVIPTIITMLIFISLPSVLFTIGLSIAMTMLMSKIIPVYSKYLPPLLGLLFTTWFCFALDGMEESLYPIFDGWMSWFIIAFTSSLITCIVIDVKAKKNKDKKHKIEYIIIKLLVLIMTLLPAILLGWYGYRLKGSDFIEEKRIGKSILDESPRYIAYYAVNSKNKEKTYVPNFLVPILKNYYE